MEKQEITYIFVLFSRRKLLEIFFRAFLLFLLVYKGSHFVNADSEKSINKLF